MKFKEIKNTLQNLSSDPTVNLLLAHSGGVDSSVLAELLLSDKKKFSVAHCNFKLRDKNSDADEKFVIDWCNKNNVPFFTKCFDIEFYKKENKQSTQVAARNLRYQWFKELCKTHGFSYLLTAHNLNDQFETFLINATRGTGISGLLGIKDTEWLKRPLKNISKNEIIAYANWKQISWREDDSNATDVYLRNQFRHHLIEPWLERNPNTLTNFKTTLNHLKEADQFFQNKLEILKKKIFNKQSNEFDLNAIEKLPQKEFCIHYFFSPLGFSSKEVIKLLKAQKGKVLYSSSFRLIKEQKTLVLSTHKENKKENFILNIEASHQDLPIPLIWETLLLVQKKTWGAHQAALDKKKLKSQLIIRKYQKGDYFYPTNMNGKKLLSKFFKDEKYTTLAKESQWLLCSGQDIVWVIGKRCDRRFISNETHSEILLMQLEL